MKFKEAALLAEMRMSRFCHWCGRPTPNGCQVHHVACKGFGGGGWLDLRENVLAVCWECHPWVQKPDKVPAHAQYCVIAARDGLPVELVEEFVRAVRRLDKSATQADVQKLRAEIFGRAA